MASEEVALLDLAVRVASVLVLVASEVVQADRWAVQEVRPLAALEEVQADR